MTEDEMIRANMLIHGHDTDVKILEISEKLIDLAVMLATNEDYDKTDYDATFVQPKLILKDSKNQVRNYNLPIIPQFYFTELKEAQAAIKEIVYELDKKPITIATLNTRVDTARDLVLKLYTKTREMMKTAMFAEMAIVYGNRYRSAIDDVNKNLMHSEMLFYKGEYKKSLELSINTLNHIEPGIYNKLLKLYGEEK